MKLFCILSCKDWNYGGTRAIAGNKGTQCIYKSVLPPCHRIQDNLGQQFPSHRAFRCYDESRKFSVQILGEHQLLESSWHSN